MQIVLPVVQARLCSTVDQHGFVAHVHQRQDADVSMHPASPPDHWLKKHVSCDGDTLGHVTILCDGMQMFQAMSNTNAAVWEASNLPNPPLDVRLISTTGQSVTAVYVFL